MRIAYIHNIAMPGPEANTVNVAKMCNAMAELGHDVTLIATPGCGQGDLLERIRSYYALKNRFQVVAMPQSARRPSVAAVLGTAAARRLRADLVVTRSPHAALAACLAGLPTLLEAHADLSAFSDLGRAAFRRAVRHPRLVGLVVISNALAEDLAVQLAPVRPRFCVAHDGADAHGAPVPSGDSSQRLQACYVGRPYRGKGLDLIAALASACPWADFHIVGAGAAQLAELGVDTSAPNFHVHGAMPHAEVAPFMERADVVLAPYQRVVIVADGRTNTARWMSPLKLFEYMASAKAIIASDLPAIREVLEHGATALLVDPEDIGAWTEALTRLRNDRRLRNRLAAQAYAAFTTRHTWKQRAAHILNGLAPARV